MGNTAMLVLAASLSPSVAVTAVGALRCRRRRPGINPAPYVRYRPEQDPGVIAAEHLVSDAYQLLGDLYPTTGPTLVPVPAHPPRR